MHQAGDRAVGAVTNIGCRASDRTGGGESSKEGRRDVGEPLANEFLIRVVLCVGHPVGHHRRQQRFDRAK